MRTRHREQVAVPGWLRGGGDQRAVLAVIRHELSEVTKLHQVGRWASMPREMARDDEARSLWAAEYPRLSEGEPGLLGAILGRAEAHVLRLSLIYAVLDQSPVVRMEHLRAALAVWDYAEASARLILEADGSEYRSRIGSSRTHRWAVLVLASGARRRGWRRPPSLRRTHADRERETRHTFHVNAPRTNR